jgi:hypothetical protein
MKKVTKSTGFWEMMLNIQGGIINIYFYPGERGVRGSSFLI